MLKEERFMLEGEVHVGGGGSCWRGVHDGGGRFISEGRGSWGEVHDGGGEVHVGGGGSY